VHISIADLLTAFFVISGIASIISVLALVGWRRLLFRVPAGRPIFISYRQADSLPYAAHIREVLTKHFGRGRVFQDMVIPPGVDFREHIDQQLRVCGAVVAVIGPRWVTKRLADPKDLLRQELEFVLEHRIPIVPVLVGGARPLRADHLPDSLHKVAGIQALPLYDQVFHVQMQELVKRLEALLQESGAPSQAAVRARYLDGVGWLLAATMIAVNLEVGAAPWIAVLAGAAVLAAWLVAGRMLRGPGVRSSRSRPSGSQGPA
jgi:hypothetical protein